MITEAEFFNDGTVVLVCRVCKNNLDRVSMSELAAINKGHYDTLCMDCSGEKADEVHESLYDNAWPYILGIDDRVFVIDPAKQLRYMGQRVSFWRGQFEEYITRSTERSRQRVAELLVSLETGVAFTTRGCDDV